MIKKVTPLINREISWLFFNERVLQEAGDPTVPLIERIKFLAIFSSNLDEFFRVRVATVKRLSLLSAKDQKKVGYKPRKLLTEIKQLVLQQQQRFNSIYNDIIIPELAEEKIFLIDERQLNVTRGRFVRQHFSQHILPNLVPVMLDGLARFPGLKDESIYLIVKLSRKDGQIKPGKALIEVPTHIHSRFLVLPETEDLKYIILLDDVIRYCLDDIFAAFDYDQFNAYTIKLTRDAELDFDSDFAESFLEKMSKTLKQRKVGAPVRFTYDNAIPESLLTYLKRKMKIRTADLIPGGRYHNFKDFMDFPNVGGKRLEYSKPRPLMIKGIDLNKSMLKLTLHRNILLSYPYQSFEYLVHFLREAAINPKVTAIKITLYRVANKSMVINALMNAAKNGKKVFVLMELKARFDEEANIYWTQRLKDEGVTVRYGYPHVKVHSKICLVISKENKRTRKYAYLATGNFNEKTARIYADHGYFTADKRITNEINRVFNELENGVAQPDYKHLWVAPHGLRKRVVQCINKEIKNALRGKKAYIFLKVNSLVDEGIIAKLYEASQAGVSIRLIVRGICCLVPGVKGKSENIRAISIVDRYLEHARIFIFANEGKEIIYLSSADLMSRNLDHRIEVAFPVYDAESQQTLRDLLEIQWKDCTKARMLTADQLNAYRRPYGKEVHRAQVDIYQYLKNKI